MVVTIETSPSPSSRRRRWWWWCGLENTDDADPADAGGDEEYYVCQQPENYGKVGRDIRLT